MINERCLWNKNVEIIVCKSYIFRQEFVTLGVKSCGVREVGEPRLSCSHALGKVYGFGDRLMRVVRLHAKSVDDECVNALEQCFIRFGDRLHIGDICQTVVEDKPKDGQVAVHHADGKDIDAS